MGHLSVTHSRRCSDSIAVSNRDLVPEDRAASPNWTVDPIRGELGTRLTAELTVDHGEYYPDRVATGDGNPLNRSP